MQTTSFTFCFPWRIAASAKQKILLWKQETCWVGFAETRSALTRYFILTNDIIKSRESQLLCYLKPKPAFYQILSKPGWMACMRTVFAVYIRRSERRGFLEIVHCELFGIRWSLLRLQILSNWHLESHFAREIPIPGKPLYIL